MVWETYASTTLKKSLYVYVHGGREASKEGETERVGEIYVSTTLKKSLCVYVHRRGAGERQRGWGSIERGTIVNSLIPLDTKLWLGLNGIVSQVWVTGCVWTTLCPNIGRV